MIVLLNDTSLIKGAAYRLRLLNRNAATRDINLQARESFAFISQAHAYKLNVCSLRKGAETLKYFNKYINLKYLVYLTNESLDTSKKSIDNVFRSYKDLLDKFSRSELYLDKNFYENRKKANSKQDEFIYVNSFRDTGLFDTESLKHPDKTDYYFDRQAFCNTDNNLLSLPVASSREVKIQRVSVDTNRSSNGQSEDPVEHVRTTLTSHQYVVHSKSVFNNGAKLCYILDFDQKKKINQIEITDSSLTKCLVSRLFTIGASEEDLSFKRVSRGTKDIILFEDVLETKRLYVEFTQNKYIDTAKKAVSIKDKIISSTANIFEPKKSDPTDYYIYEFNIDRIKPIYNIFKKVGLFRLAEEINLVNKTTLSVSLSGDFLNFTDIQLYLKYTVNKAEGFENTETYKKKIVDGTLKLDPNSIKGQLILVMNSKSNYRKLSSYIKSISIEVV